MKSIKTIARIAILSSLLYVIQVVLAGLPNIELVSFLVVVIGLGLPLYQGIIICSIFAILEMLTYGISDWVITYLWIWSFLIILAKLSRSIIENNRIAFALLMGLFGLFFGFLSGFPTLILNGVNAFIAYFIKGLIFDLIHSVSNFIIGLILFDVAIRLKKILINNSFK